MKNNLLKLLWSLTIFVVTNFIMGCSDNFLEEKPNSGLVIPSSLDDFQELLDNNLNTNQPFDMNRSPELGELSSDNYYLIPSFYDIMDNVSKKAHIWSNDIYSETLNDPNWDIPYQQIFVANVVIEGLDNIVVNGSKNDEWMRIKGSALFYRANAYYNLSQIFCPVYDPATSIVDLGLPLKVASDINKIEQRSNLQQTYDRILEDLNFAQSFLTNDVDFNNPNRPSLSAVYALKARVLLSMRNYDSAFEAANNCLLLHNKIIDFNTLNTTIASPIPILHDENIFFSKVLSSTYIFFASESSVMIDSLLYSSYSPNDLRKSIYFRLNSMGKPYRKNGYSRSYEFTGLATDEIYLIRAECYARRGDLKNAMIDLNTLLIKRFDNTFLPLVANSLEDALEQVLTERRKELLYRGTRWSDLRRLNKEGYKITLTRILNGQTYTLPPNDGRYILPIPPDEILRSGIEQNVR